MQDNIWQAVGQWQKDCQEAMQSGSDVAPLPPITIPTYQAAPPTDDYVITTQSSPCILNGNYSSEHYMLISPSNTTSSSASPRSTGWIQVDKLDVKRDAKTFMNLSCSLQPGLREDHV